jgi:putative SOS response-associated peptidase YedK
MCGRYASYRRAQDLVDRFHVDDVTEAAEAAPPSYNLAPTEPVRIILDRAGEVGSPRRREMHAARWGLVPAWAKDLRVGNRLINARLESVATKPAFRASLARRRCIVPADGYFEWQRRDGRKVPFYIYGEAGEPLALAGLYAFWRDPGRAEDDPGRWVLSVTIVTTDAEPALAELHDRRPVVLDPAAVPTWLDPDPLDAERAVATLRRPPPPLRFHAVSERVNTPATEGPDLIAPV